MKSSTIDILFLIRNSSCYDRNEFIKRVAKKVNIGTVSETQDSAMFKCNCYMPPEIPSNLAVMNETNIRITSHQSNA